jgi:hypothetical protein
MHQGILWHRMPPAMRIVKRTGFICFLRTSPAHNRPLRKKDNDKVVGSRNGARLHNNRSVCRGCLVAIDAIRDYLIFRVRYPWILDDEAPILPCYVRNIARMGTYKSAKS